MKTLGYLHDIPSIQDTKNVKNFPYPLSTKLLHTYHSDMRNLSRDYLAKTSNMSQIFKQHIPPTENNLELLKYIKKIILLREPEEIIEAYYRAEIKGLHKPRQEFQDCKTLESWKEEAHRNGLFDDLNWFFNEWKKESQKDTNMNLLIDYSNLIINPKNTINEIERFLKLSTSKKVFLSKERYSRKSSFLKFNLRLINKIFSKLIK
jgi:hypothetical protein